MKKLLLAMVAGAALASPWAALAEPASYLKLAVGPSHYSGTLRSADETAWNLAYGQAIDENWGYEVGYIHFGEVSRGAAAQYSNYRSHALYAAGVAKMPLNKAAHAYAKLGLASIASRSSGPASFLGSALGTRTDTNLIGGFGIDYRFSPQVSGNIEYQYFGDTFHSAVTLSAWTVGLRYGF
jgi:opacity protein-like surface antigen